MTKTIIAGLVGMLLTGASYAEVTNLNPHPKAGAETAKQHLQYVQKNYQTMFPTAKPADYEIGSLMFDPGARAYAKDWQDRIDDAEFGRPEEVAKFYAKGKQIFETPFPNGQTFAQCLPKGGQMIAGNYPQFNKKTGKVETFEIVVNQCVVANGGTEYKANDTKEFWPLMGYIRSLSNGMKVNVKVEGKAAQAAFNQGRDYFYTRQGKLNFACASCHIDAAGKQLRSETLSPVIGQAPHFPAFRPNKEGMLQPWTLQRRYERCQEQIAVDEKEKAVQGSETLNNLEYFHTYLSNGLTYVMGVFRK